MACTICHLTVAVLLSGLVGCGNESTSNSPTSHGPNIDVQSSPSLAQRMLINLGDRATWPSNSVKIWLENPTVSVALSLPENDPVDVYAWAKNENDFNVAMMQIDRGSTLYAITDDEFLALKVRQDSAAVP